MGASGYMGGEALRVLLEHPQVEIAWATSRDPGPAARDHPNLRGAGLEWIHPDEVGDADVVFLALPTAASIPEARRFLDAGSRVIDLGAAFRLGSRECWERVYRMSHPDWSLCEEAVYGLPELHADEIAGARLVANPGCYPTAAILALAPLVRERWIDTQHVVVDGLSGTAGAGASLDRAIHHPEIGNSLVPYNVVGHRHTFEMEQELSQESGGHPVRVHFTPVYTPMIRGILDLCHAPLLKRVGREEVLALLREHYADSPLIHVIEEPYEPGAEWQSRPYPSVSAVAGTNRCHIGADVDPERGHVVVLAALDSIGKGGAHGAVENMNLMLGLSREVGVSRFGAHPA